MNWLASKSQYSSRLARPVLLDTSTYLAIANSVCRLLASQILLLYKTFHVVWMMVYSSYAGIAAT